MRKITLDFVKERLLELDPCLAGAEVDKSYETGLVLLSALSFGPDAARLAEFTELPQQFVATIRMRMIRAELWSESDTCCDHWFVTEDAFCAVSFWTDVLVAEGLVVRRWVEEEGNYRYWDRDSVPRNEHWRQKAH